MCQILIKDMMCSLYTRLRTLNDTRVLLVVANDNKLHVVAKCMVAYHAF
jgi:hypothetical protein